MSDLDLVIECKKSLKQTADDFDNLILQKISFVKAYMSGAGVSDVMIETDTAMGLIVLAVTDLWELKSGEVKFSPIFKTLMLQLQMDSLEL